jgi:cell wall-associated NlpC family hydrolase
MSGLDRRLNAYHPDLAAKSLRGSVEATRFTEGRPMQVIRGCADLRRGPADSEPLESQLLFGEEVLVFDEADGWAWIQNKSDHYVGYVARSALSETVVAPTHVVSAVRTFVFPEPDLKTPPSAVLSMTTPLHIDETREAFSHLASGGWVYNRHLALLDALEPDYVKTALRFLEVPYLWGGKSSLGLDCSALIQLVLARSGIVTFRDSDQQAESIGEPLPWTSGKTPPNRGDLLFMPGHVAIALDEDSVVHANAYAMAVAIEPWRDLEARVMAESGQGISGRRRLTSS